MSETKNLLNKYSRLILFFTIFLMVVVFVVWNVRAFGNVLCVLLGFGAVIIVHEFGHFIVAKLSDIKVEVFSIGFSPILAGILRTEKGFRVRILPGLLPVSQGDDSDGSLATFTIGKAGKAGETEYRIGLIPFGGYVKMLGQEDTKAAQVSDDPRSFANKSVASRAAVIVAGVTFNAVSAVLIFMLAFLIGIRLTPAVVGAVVRGSPAQRAGLVAGDEIIRIAGKNHNLDFSNIGVAAALSDVNEAIKLRVRHQDGNEEDFAIVAEQLAGSEKMRLFGIMQAQTLNIGEVDDVNALYEATGLRPGDTIKTVSGKDVQNHWDLIRIVEDSLGPAVKILAERKIADDQVEFVESEIKLEWNFAESYEAESESQLYHICSMVPRLRITAVRKLRDSNPALGVGDIIVAAADVENPTYTELRETIDEYKGRKLAIKVLRSGNAADERIVSVTVVPVYSKASNRVIIGIGIALDAEHPVVAKTIGAGRLAIPRGAVITAVDGAEVSSFYDCVEQIRKNAGQRITIDYRLDEDVAGNVALDLTGARADDLITVKSAFGQFVPFEELKRLYKAEGPIDAVVMGYKKTVMFIAQSYITIKRLLAGLLSPKLLMGPVGIITLSYKIVAQQPLIYYVYFLGLLNACIAVMNLLPLLPFDGGVLVLLFVEKLKGSPLNERIQAALTYASLVLIGAFFLYVTFNDIVRSFLISR